MTSYAKRTCHICGVHLPTNKMHAVFVNTSWKGRSRKSVTPLTFIGALIGSKKAVGALESWIFNTANRKYTGGNQTTKWACYKHVGQLKRKYRKPRSAFFYITAIFWFPYYLMIKINLILIKYFFWLLKKILIILYWLFLKLVKLIGKKAHNFADQDCDGKLDLNDFKTAANKVSKLIKSKKITHNKQTITDKN